MFLVKGKLDSCKPGACSHEAELKVLEGSSSDWMPQPSTHTVGNTAFQVKNTVLFSTPGNTCCCPLLSLQVSQVFLWCLASCWCSHAYTCFKGSDLLSAQLLEAKSFFGEDPASVAPKAKPEKSTIRSASKRRLMHSLSNDKRSQVCGLMGHRAQVVSPNSGPPSTGQRSPGNRSTLKGAGPTDIRGGLTVCKAGARALQPCS